MFLNKKDFELYIPNDKKDLSYMFIRIERTWAIYSENKKDLFYTLLMIKGLELSDFNDKKDLSYMFIRI